MSENSSSYIDFDVSSNCINDGENLVNKITNKYDFCEEFIDFSTDY